MKLTGIKLVYWLAAQVEAARNLRNLYLVASLRPGWTTQAQQMLDGVSDNLAFFEGELEEARLCLQ